MNRACRALGLLFFLFSKGTFVKAEDPLPMPGAEIQAGNKIEWDAKSPNSPKSGQVFASGTVTPAKDWTCKKVTISVYNATKMQLDTKDVVPGANGAWTHTFMNLPGAMNAVLVDTGTFEKGKTSEKKSTNEANLTVRP